MKDTDSEKTLQELEQLFLKPTIPIRPNRAFVRNTNKFRVRKNPQYQRTLKVVCNPQLNDIAFAGARELRNSQDLANSCLFTSMKRINLHVKRIMINHENLPANFFTAFGFAL